MTPQPSTPIHLTLDPATTDEALATIFGALRRNPERTPAQHQTQRDAGALMIAALRPSNPIEAAYAVRATAAHFASMECFRRTTQPDTPDIVGQRWFGKALALSRMSSDMMDALTDCQEAAPHAKQQPGGRPDERQSDDRLSQALAAEVARRAAVARAKAAETPASPAAPDRRNPKPSERPAFTPAAPAVSARPAAAVAAKPADMPAGPSPLDPRAGPAVSARRDPLSSERTTLPPAVSAIVTGPAAVSCLAPTLPPAGLRAGLLSSTSLSGLSSLSSGVVPVPVAAPVMPVKRAGS